jgi:hypothetical protein
MKVLFDLEEITKAMEFLENKIKELEKFETMWEELKDNYGCDLSTYEEEEFLIDVIKILEKKYIKVKED